MMIIARPARLLECLEFDPEDFYNQMVDMEGEMRTMAMIHRMNQSGQTQQQIQQQQQQQQQEQQQQVPQTQPSSQQQTQLGNPISVQDTTGLLPGSAHVNLGYEDGSCVLDIARYVMTYLGVSRDPVPGDVVNSLKESDSGSSNI